MDRDMYGPEHEGPDADDECDGYPLCNEDTTICGNPRDDSYESERGLRYAESCDGFSCED